MAGFVKLHRCILHKAIWKNPNLFRVFSWCLMKATWIEYEEIVGMTKVVLQPGQFVFGRFKAAEELGLKPSTVVDCMKWLKANTTIDIKSNNKFSLVTVINWDLYQSEEDESDTKSDTKSDNKPTTSRQQADTNKNTKKVKKEKNIYGSQKNVHLTAEEYERLKNEFVVADEAIEYLSGYMVEKGYTSKDHNRTIRRWVVDAVNKRLGKNNTTSFKDFV